MTNPNTAPSAEAPSTAQLLVDRLKASLRIPAMPFPDPDVHGWASYSRSVHSAYCAVRFKIIDAIALAETVARMHSAQTGGEAVAPEAKPEWPKGAFFTDGEGNFYDEQAEPLDHAFAPPAPPAPPDRAQRSGVSADPLPDRSAAKEKGND